MAELSPRVLFHTADWAFQCPGGGEVQILQTQRYLTELGVEVVPFDPWRSRIADFPLVHSFGLAGHASWAAVKAAGVPLVVSPIHWPLGGRHSFRGNLTPLIFALKRKVVHLRRSGWVPALGMVDLFLPNSWMEADQLCRFYGLPKERMHPVPNGVEERFLQAEPALFTKEYGLRDFILVVGRIEPRKNQLGVIRALRGLDRPLVFLGEPVPAHAAYFEECRRAAGKDVHFLGRLAHDSPLLASAYAAASLLLLASYVETPGLCALEAGLAGTPVVITSLGSTREYFEDHALYVHPDAHAQIREAVQQTLANPPDPEGLRQRILSRYLWRNTAAATREAYGKVLGLCHEAPPSLKGV